MLFMKHENKENSDADMASGELEVIWQLLQDPYNLDVPSINRLLIHEAREAMQLENPKKTTRKIDKNPRYFPGDVMDYLAKRLRENNPLPIQEMLQIKQKKRAEGETE